MFDRVTEATRRLLLLAEGEAVMLGHSYISTGHVLLVLLHGNANFSVVRDVVQRRPGDEGPVVLGEKPMTYLVLSVLERAERLAGPECLGDEHVRQAILELNCGVAREIIRAFPGLLEIPAPPEAAEVPDTPTHDTALMQLARWLTRPRGVAAIVVSAALFVVSDGQIGSPVDGSAPPAKTQMYAT